MAELKTKVSDQSVDEFLDGLDDENRRQDCRTVLDLMRQVTATEPKMWGSSIVGFGSYHYKYESGREGEWFLTGFSPRKQALTLYIMSGFKRYELLLRKLGKHKRGKSCLYVKRIEDIDLATLTELIEQSVQHLSGSSGKGSG